jgi:cytochrome b6-f complex iron-sulfur subunit
MNAPLLDQANADVTPNPSKAPWYLLNLQELLLHMNAAMAGVIVPTIWLIILGAFPYFDRDSDGQGSWFGTEGAVKLTIVSGLVGIVGTWALILWDSGKIAFFLNDWFGFSGGDRFRFLENVRLDSVPAPMARLGEQDYLPAVQPEASCSRHARADRRRSSTSTSRAGSSSSSIPTAPSSVLPSLMIYGTVAGWLGGHTAATRSSRSSAASSPMAYSRSSDRVPRPGPGAGLPVGTQGRAKAFRARRRVTKWHRCRTYRTARRAHRTAPARSKSRKLARRSFLRVSAFAGLSLFVGSMTAGFLGFFNLRKPVGFGGVVTVSGQPRSRRAGALNRSVSRKAKFWLVNLQGPEGDVLGVGGTGGLLALYWKCPHLGCSVPWNASGSTGPGELPGVIGWFRCPCHGSTYSTAGIRVFGPAPRPMDTMEITKSIRDGSLGVNTGKSSPSAPSTTRFARHHHRKTTPDRRGGAG